MPNQPPDHGPVIAALFAAHRADQDPDRAVATLAAALAALWRRAERTLGAVLLGAVADRVLHEARAQYSFLMGAVVGESGFSLEGLSLRAAGVAPEDVQAAARMLLVRFLSVLGNLTGDVLTSALHGELAQLTEARTLPGESDES